METVLTLLCSYVAFRLGSNYGTPFGYKGIFRILTGTEQETVEDDPWL